MAGKNKGKNKNLMDGTVAVNRRARFDYEILETIEAGLVLMGTEVKALRNNGASLNEAYAGIKDGELYLFNVQIAEYPNAPRAFQHEPKRLRKLLVHKKERDKLIGAIKRDGMTLVPLSLFFNGRGLCKLSLGLAKGKKAHDKRETIKERDWQRRKGQLLREAG